MTKLLTLLKDQKFWITLLLLVCILASNLFAFELPAGIDERAVEIGAAVVIVVNYLISAAIDPGGSGWAGLLQSRKFWSAVVGFLSIVLNTFKLPLPFHLTPDQAIEICLVLSGWLFSIAIKDSKAYYLQVFGAVEPRR